MPLPARACLKAKELAFAGTDRRCGTLGTRHLIAQNYSNHRYPVRDVDPLVSILNFHYAWPEAATLNAGLGRVVSFDETGFANPNERCAAPETDAVYRKQAWEFLFAGGGIFSMLDYSFTVGHEDGTFTNNAPGGGSSASSRTSCRLLTSRAFDRGRRWWCRPPAPLLGRSGRTGPSASTSGATAGRG